MSSVSRVVDGYYIETNVSKSSNESDGVLIRLDVYKLAQVDNVIGFGSAPPDRRHIAYFCDTVTPPNWFERKILGLTSIEIKAKQAHQELMENAFSYIDKIKAQENIVSSVRRTIGG